MLSKILIALVLVGGGLLAVRALNRAATLSSQNRTPVKDTTQDLVQCQKCGIYHQPDSDAGCQHCNTSNTSES